jgi:signal transduction histidine kinase
LPAAIEVDAEALQEVKRVLRSLRPGPLARLIRRLVQ